MKPLQIALGVVALIALSLYVWNFSSASSVDAEAAAEPYVDPIQKATFGTGCFWCTEAIFESIDGVSKVESGYTGGATENPTYNEVCGGETGHAEVVQLTFDAREVSYNDLLHAFWLSHDPTTLNRQGSDEGTQYRSAIFAHDEKQMELAQSLLNQLNEEQVFGKPVVTEVSQLGTFYPAELNHQDYFQNNAEGFYCQRAVIPKLEKFKMVFEAFKNVNRDTDLNKIKKPDSEWREILTDEQYRITRRKGTERAFAGNLWDNKRDGTYRCVCCDLPLFDASTKFRSGTGWPSFYDPLNSAHVARKTDKSLFTSRTEVVCTRCDAHLGHVFNDGPRPTGQRYCINSAALNFEAKESGQE